MNKDGVFSRTEMILGKEQTELLSRSSVIVFGLGGVGSYAAEALVRTGIGRIALVDSDTVAPSNINRQLIATENTVLMKKTLAAKERFLSVNPKIEILEADERSLAANRIYMHYSAEEFMLAEDEIMDNIGKIHHIPTLIVHNRLDFVCPPSNAYKLHKAMQNSKLVIVPDKGHSSKMLSAVNKKEMAEFLKNV